MISADFSVWTHEVWGPDWKLGTSELNCNLRSQSIHPTMSQFQSNIRKIYTQKIQCNSVEIQKILRINFLDEQSFFTLPPGWGLQTPTSLRPEQWREGVFKKTNEQQMLHVSFISKRAYNHKGLSSKLCMIRLWLLPHNEIKCLCTLSTFYHLGPRRLDSENKVYVGGS